MIAVNLPVLQVVVPLLAAPICLLLRRPAAAWTCAFLVGLSCLAMSAALLCRVLESGTLSYALGGWAPPWGIEYRIDAVNAFVLLIVSAIGAVVLLYARRGTENEIEPARLPLFYAAFLLCLAGLLGIAATGDAFNLFVFLEISSLSSYILISLGQRRRALTAAFQYLIMGTIGATFILIGIGMLYMVTGTLNMQDLAARLPALMELRTVHSAFAFLLVGLCLKLALFPLHLWLPDAYTHAPSVVSAFLAGTATKVAVYALLRISFTVFGAGFALSLLPLDAVLVTLALLGVFVGSTVAIFQDNVKRMLAWSSIAQVGYMILGISLATVTGLTAGILHLFNHALMKGGLFLALGAVLRGTGGVRLADLRGIGRSMPWTAAAIVIGGLSLVGVPLTVGFVSKWYLVLAALELDNWLLAAAVLAGSLLALAYVWRLVETAYFAEPEEGAPAVREAPLALLLPIWLLIGANLWFGIDTELTTGVAARAARELLGVMP